MPPDARANARFLVRTGGWLFRQRTWIPVPLVAALLLLPPGCSRYASPSVQVAAGALLVALGEALRLWAVRHIGVISRTRSDRLGPLIETGPFAIVRNPLYLGNVALWSGLAIMAQLPWLAPVFVVVLGLEYHAIVEWEEDLLRARRGEEYQRYAARVPRWLPRRGTDFTAVSRSDAVSSWSDTLFSERGTLIAIGVGCLLLWAKNRNM